MAVNTEDAIIADEKEATDQELMSSKTDLNDEINNTDCDTEENTPKTVSLDTSPSSESADKKPLNYEAMFEDRYSTASATYCQIMKGFEPAVVVHPWDNDRKRTFDHANHRGGRGGRFYRDRGGYFNNRGHRDDRGRGRGRYDRPYHHNRDDRQNHYNRDDRSNYLKRHHDDDNRRGGYEGAGNQGGNQFHGNRNTYYPGRS